MTLLNGIESEINYWKIVCKNPILFKNTLEIRLNSEFPVSQFIENIFENIVGDINILDVGSGPVTSIGYKSSRKVNITAVDFLAAEYNAILQEHNIISPIKTEIGSAEDLSKYHNKYQVVTCCNALDHMENPQKAIEEMTKCIDKGFIIIWCYENTGEREQYVGLHKWNMYINDNKVMLKHKDGQELEIKNELLDYFSIERIIGPPDKESEKDPYAQDIPVIICKMRKK